MSLKLTINNFLKTTYNKKKYKKLLNHNLITKKTLLLVNNKNLNSYFIKFVVSITIKKSNMFVYIIDCLNTKNIFFSTKSLLKHKMKNLKFNNLENFYKILISKCKFLKNKPIAIHFNCLELNYKWFLQKLAKKMFIIIIKFFNKYAYNGCRKKKTKN